MFLYCSSYIFCYKHNYSDRFNFSVKSFTFFSKSSKYIFFLYLLFLAANLFFANFILFVSSLILNNGLLTSWDSSESLIGDIFYNYWELFWENIYYLCSFGGGCTSIKVDILLKYILFEWLTLNKSGFCIKRELDFCFLFLLDGGGEGGKFTK